jgi:LacI family transcriptional regulator
MRSKTIGLVLPDISHYFLSAFARSIILHARRSDLSVLLCDSMEDTEIEEDSIELLLSDNVDGLIILPVGKEGRHIQEIYSKGVPLVVADRVLPEIECPSVSVDNYAGAKEAVDYLIDCGHRRIACIQRLPDSWINNERVRAYRDSLIARGLPVDESLIIGDKFGQRNGYLEVKLLLAEHPKPSAIFALSHLIALGALRAIQEEGLHVPDDISLLSFDDIPFPEYFRDAVTSVQQPSVEMGLMAVNFLLEQIESKIRAEPKRIQLPTTLIRRKSVKRITETRH